MLSNIVQKGDKNVEIRIPLYVDEETEQSELQNGQEKDLADEKYVFMDSTLFGATGCSLQVTMQARNLEEACKLHDGLIALDPVLLALTAGTPIFRGLLADTDTRWACFEQAVDDRTEEQVKAGNPARS